ncbi:hypothetical protein M231_01271 [Tremella mesenterica]|uniref:Uncharacterized protein n=1 Tax=Tremella mesenterica TaxID=5217 RepID=A0A4Q1BTL5_TREME|nr:hypothetical protein M231_01271 [Tremella mesenterica]
MTNITTSHVTYPVTTITATPPPTTNELVTDNMSMVETIGTEENSITITNAELCKAPPSKRSWLQNLQKRTDNCRRALKALRTRAMVESQTAAVTRTTQTKLSIIEKTDLDLIFISNVLSVAWHVELMKGRKVIELNREYKTLCSKLTEAADEFATQKSRGMKHVLSLKATLTSYRTLLDGYNIDTALKDEKVDIIAAATKLYEQQVSRSCP